MLLENCLILSNVPRDAASDTQGQGPIGTRKSVDVSCGRIPRGNHLQSKRGGGFPLGPRKPHQSFLSLFPKRTREQAVKQRLSR